MYAYANVKAREAGEGRCKPLSDDGGALRVRVDHGEGGGPGLGRGGAELRGAGLRGAGLRGAGGGSRAGASGGGTRPGPPSE